MTIYPEPWKDELVSLFKSSRQRVIHDERQITDSSQFEEGEFYQTMQSINGAKRPSEKFVFLGLSRDGNWIKAKKTYLENEIEISLRDMGIIPYKNNACWNSTNYIIPVKEEK